MKKSYEYFKDLYVGECFVFKGGVYTKRSRHTAHPVGKSGPGLPVIAILPKVIVTLDKRSLKAHYDRLNVNKW